MEIIDEGELVNEQNREEQSQEKDNKKISDNYKELVDQGRVEFITFHPSYSYEEFIEGITVDSDSEGQSDFDYMIKDGIFKRVCARALAKAMGKDDWKSYGNPDMKGKNAMDAVNGDYNWKSIYKEYKENQRDELDWEAICENPENRFLLIIDEINRGDISKIFGELITLIEKDKRLEAKEEKIARLTYSSQEFAVPPNVYLLGTMNTADRSIALLDVALRRRFSFEGMYPDEQAFQELREEFDIAEDEDGILSMSIDTLEKINDKIRDDERLGRDKMVGQSYFYQVDGKDDEKGIMNAWKYDIFPLLEEYCWDNKEQLKNIVNIDGDGIYQQGKLSRDEETIKKWLGVET